jgi:hypothetical protein
MALPLTAAVANFYVEFFEQQAMNLAAKETTLV